MPNKTPVGDMPRMVPDREDIRQRSQEKMSGAHDRKPAPKQATEPKQKNNWVLVFLVILSGVAIGFLSLQQYSMTQLLNSYEERLELADERIVGLERALTETDESVSLNGTAINAQFKAIKNETDLHMSEIRKLWDVTNKRNRNWIEENKAALETQTQKLNSALASLAKVIDAQAVDASAISSINEVMSQSETQLDEINQAVTELDVETQSISTTLESFIGNNYEEQILSLTLTQENMLAVQNDVGSTADKNADGITDILIQIDAIDASRVETSRRLSALTSQIETLNSRLTALTGSSP